MKSTGILAAALVSALLLTASPVCAAKNEEKDWQLAYQKVLTTYSRMQGFEGGASKEDYGARWDLFDIDGDGTPELFISPDNSHAYGVMIYTCFKGEPKLLQTADQQAFGEFGMAAVNVEQHLLGSFHTGSGIVQQAFYRLEQGQLVETASFMSDIESYPDPQKNLAVWQVNGRNVSQTDYEAAYAEYEPLVWKEDVGRAYAFSDRSPLASDAKMTVAAAPPDMKAALAAGSVSAVVVAAAAALVSILMRRKRQRRGARANEWQQN